MRGLAWGASSEEVTITETATFVAGRMRPQQLEYALRLGDFAQQLVYELPHDRLQRVVISSRLAASDCVLLFGGQGGVAADPVALGNCNDEDVRARFTDLYARLAAQYGTPLAPDPAAPPPGAYFPGCTADAREAVVIARASPIQTGAFIAVECRWQTRRTQAVLHLRAEPYASLRRAWSMPPAPIAADFRFLVTEVTYTPLEPIATP